MLDTFRAIIATYPNLTVRQLAALLVMCEHPHIKSSQLAATLKVHRAVVSRIWDILTAYGLVVRTRATDDLRLMHGNLTDKGRAFCNQLTTEI
jgi:DNA-binding MarR family transcriptional regulator